MTVSPHIMIIIASVIWGSSGAFIKYINLPPATMVCFRTIVPVLFILPFLKRDQLKVSLSADGPMLVASTLNAIRLLLYMTAFSYTTIGNAIVIYYTKPIFITALSAMVLKERIHAKTLLALLVGFVGVVLMYATTGFEINADFLGMTAMLTAAFLDAVGSVIIKKEISKYQVLQPIYLLSLVSIIVFLPAAIVRGPMPTLLQFFLGTIYGVLIGLAAFALYLTALKRITVSTASILSYTEVASAIIFGIIFFSEAVTWNLVAGLICIVTATVLVKKDSQ